jgi:hypothetical protein
MQLQTIKPLTPIEYEILFALASLRFKGKKEVILPEIKREINLRRKEANIKPLISQIIYYHLKKLSKRPFVVKKNAKRNTRYCLKNGHWKLKTAPPLCIFISENEGILALPCLHTKTCRLIPLSDECLKTLKTPKI